MSCFVTTSIGPYACRDTFNDIVNKLQSVIYDNPKKIIKVDCSGLLRLDSDGVRALVMYRNVIPVNLSEEHVIKYDREKRKYVRYDEKPRQVVESYAM